MWVVYYEKGSTRGYVRKHDGMNSFHSDPREASLYLTPEAARESGLVGHHRDMGGDGILGAVVSLRSAFSTFAAQKRRRSIY